MWEKPKTFEDAKKLAAGAAGIEFEKYPLKFVTPAYFGARPQPGTQVTVNSGSASLVRLNGQSFALTCSHVLEAYRQRLAEGPCIFQLGDCELDPMAQLKAEDTGLDYALIGLTEEQGKEIAKSGGPFDGTFFCDLAQWPPGDVKEGDFVAFGGFPGELRKAESFDKLSFGSFSSGAAKVTTTGDDYLVCQFEREHWVTHGFEPEPSTIRGMSGGPVFAIRHSETGIMTYEFMGHISEFQENYELLAYALIPHPPKLARPAAQRPLLSGLQAQGVAVREILGHDAFRPRPIPWVRISVRYGLSYGAVPRTPASTAPTRWRQPPQGEVLQDDPETPSTTRSCSRRSPCAAWE